MAGNRLVVCFDGTWNTPDNGANPTNVVKILRAIRTGDDHGTRQIVFYDKGVGTGGFTDRIAGGASGAGLTDNMVDGYRFLANNWRDGDEIYIFGFSRGAYTARCLAGFLGLAGLISPLHLGGGLTDSLAIYRNADLSFDQKQNKIDDLPLTREPSVRIRCIGVWDTVGSLGIPGDLGRRFTPGKYYFRDTLLSSKVDVALHAMAIDEKRSAFAPTLWCKPEETSSPEQIIEQVWFAGVHSNVGGSYKDAGLSDTALDWMIKRVRTHTDLAFNDDYITEYVKPDAAGKGVESRTALYKDSVLYPYQRLIKQIKPEGGGFGEWFRNRFKKFDRRSIPPDGIEPLNEMLHVSVLERCRQPVVHDCKEDKDCKPRDYRPPTLIALINACRSGSAAIPVVGRDGEILPNADVDWPRV